MAGEADIALIWLTLKPGTEGFVEKTGANVLASQKESDNVRFELYGCGADKYVLFEVYATKAGAVAHKEQAHFTEWKPWIVEQLAEGGRDRRQYKAHGAKSVKAFRGGDVGAGMEVTLVHISCKPGTEAAFIEATLKNKAGVEANEPDALRFDILQQEEDPTKFVLFECFKDAAAVSYHKTWEHYLTWRETVEDVMAEKRRGEKVQFVPVGEKSAVMKLTAKKTTGFYTKAAATFLKGSISKPPVEELVIAALGEAIGIAIAVAARLEKDGLAEVSSISTDYPEMPSRGSQYGCASIKVVLKPIGEKS